MKTLILTGYTTEIEELGNACNGTKVAYARRNGYSFRRIANHRYTKDSHPSWQKIRFIKEAIEEGFDRVVWLDADTVVTNPNVRIEDIVDPNTAITISLDWCAPEDSGQQSQWVSAGNFIINNHRMGQRTLRVLDLIEKNTEFKNRACWEQDSIIRLLRKNPQFSEEVTRIPRHALSSISSESHRLASQNQKYSVQRMSLDFLCHLTYLNSYKEKVQLADAYSRDHIHNLIQAPVWYSRGSSMDLRHILWLRDVLNARHDLQRTLEVGVYKGCSSIAFNNRPDAQFCDISLTPEAKQIIGNRKFFHTKGSSVLDVEPIYDLVVIDGAHDFKSVSEELDALLRKSPRVIVAHDVAATRNGYVSCEGAEYLHKRLFELNWYCVLDDSHRKEENTERGLLFATREKALYDEIKRLRDMSCWDSRYPAAQ